MRKILMLVVALIIILPAVVGCQNETQEKAQDFYKGKTITLIVPFRAGGGTDSQARVFGRYLEKYTGASVTVDNKDAAGGMEANNYMYTAAPKDGLTVCYTEASALFSSALLKDPTVQYDIEKFPYLFVAPTTASVFYIDSKLPIYNVDDLKEAKDLKLGIGGAATSQGGLSYAVTIEALGLDAKMIPGYRGSAESILALQKGEINAVPFPVGGMKQYEEEGIVRPLFTMASDKKYTFTNRPDIPILGEIVNLSPDLKEEMDAAVSVMPAKGAFVPPGTPQDKVDYLVEITGQIAADKGFQDEITALSTEWYDFLLGNDALNFVKDLNKRADAFPKLLQLVDKYSAAQ